MEADTRTALTRNRRPRGRNDLVVRPSPDVVRSRPADVDSDLDDLAFADDTTAEAVARNRRGTAAGWLAGLTVAALVVLAAVLYLKPDARARLLALFDTEVVAARSATAGSVPESLPTVLDVWGSLDLGSLPPDVADSLRQGRYYYEQRQPGNFGLALDYWKRALERVEGTQRPGVARLVASAEQELGRQFTADSGDVFVFLKQGRRDQAAVLLEAMRSNYLDISAPQYDWASRMLYRLRR